MGEFFAMGGYALFIWPSYAIGIGGLIVLAVISVWTLKARETELGALQTIVDHRQNCDVSRHGCQIEDRTHGS
ncbi:hypothetical protein RIEGSTA812A_PEG_78 [invertebrate metagenome]|uniref:Heme exporter protein D n=1 Tax=invertebrate metagenome TaxID=1711999 RepID=A0A484H5N4_9ZZZZ